MRPVSLFILLSAFAACTDTTPATDVATSGDTGDTTTDTTGPTDDPTDTSGKTDTDPTGDTGKTMATGADAIVPGELVITEIHHSPLAVNEELGEWFELHNTSKTKTLDLNGLVVFDGVEYFGVYQSLEIAPLGYAVFARSGDQSTNGGIVADYVFGAAMTLDTVDVINLGNGNGSLDTVRWTKYFEAQSGTAISLSSSTLDPKSNDVAENWCLARNIYGRGDRGTPGFPNPNCSVKKKGPTGPTGDTAVEPAPADSILVGDLVITEIMQNPNFVADTVGEWFEVYNSTKSDIDIRGLEVGDDASDGFTVPWDPDNPGKPITIPAGGYFVFGANSNTTLNGNVNVDYDYVRSDFFLSNGPDEVVLSNTAGVIDEIAYDGGKTSWPDPVGASMNLTSTILDATGNDDGTAWCTSTSLIDAANAKSDLGTPGAANSTCPAP